MPADVLDSVVKAFDFSHCDLCMVTGLVCRLIIRVLNNLYFLERYVLRMMLRVD